MTEGETIQGDRAYLECCRCHTRWVMRAATGLWHRDADTERPVCPDCAEGRR